MAFQEDLKFLGLVEDPTIPDVGNETGKDKNRPDASACVSARARVGVRSPCARVWICGEFYRS